MIEKRENIRMKTIYKLRRFKDDKNDKKHF